MSSHVSFTYRLNTEFLLDTLMWITPLVPFQVNINFIIIYLTVWLLAGEFILLKHEEE